MNIGETIKKLRRQKDMTQEQLAEYLGISPQAVSRWEINSTLPDITLIPMLANIFDVSTDVLLGVDIDKKENRIQAILDRAEESHRSGYQVDKARETLRAGLKEYPNSCKIMASLMRFLYYQIYDDNKSGEGQTALTAEITKLGEKILAECTDDEVRHSAIQTLCYTYPIAGETEKAVLLAQKMPLACQSRENLLAQIYSGAKRFEQQRENLFSSVGDVISGLQSHRGFFSGSEYIVLNEKVIGLLNLMFDDGNYGLYRFAMAFSYYNIAEFYAKLEKHENALENLKLAAEQAMLCDEEYDPAPDREYTALPFKGMKITSDYIKAENGQSNALLEKMAKCSAFNTIRATKEFIEIEVALKKHTNR